MRQFGGDFGAWKLSLKRFIEILKNLQKPCKVLQKWGFGESEIHEKLSLEGKLGPISKLSWLVREQVGAKRDKLTLLGRLRGAKLEPKGALEAAKEAPKGPKRATRDIGPAADVLILEVRPPPKVT